MPTSSADEQARAARVILFGTIHLDHHGATVLNARSASELGRSQRLALEADPSDAATIARVVRKYAYYAPGDGLSKHLPGDGVAVARRLAAASGVDPTQVEGFKPWFLANIAVTAVLARAGMDPEGGSEGTLARFAQQRGIPIVEIEGFEEQLALFDAEPAPLQEAQLEESSEEITSGELVSETDALIRAWHQSDSSALDALLEAMRHADAPFAKFALERLILARDRSMADRAQRFLEGDGTTFFAVGSLHLFGEAGLIEELRRRGYRVRDLQ